MKNKKPLIIIDGNNMMHRAFHANSGLSYKGKSTSVIFGMLNMVRSIITMEKPKKVIMVWDGGRNPVRMATVPDYKAGRKTDIDWDDLNRQRKAVRKLFKYLGITQVWEKSMEADDYIYWLTQKYVGKRPIKIVSNDKDFHQLLGPHVTQLIKKRDGPEVELTEQGFEAQFGFPVHYHVDYLILTGDKSDNIPGYGGIGEVRGREFIQKYEGIVNYLDECDDGKYNKDKMLQVYERNRTMIDLEYFYENHLKGKMKLEYLFNNKNPKLNKDKFITKALKYNLLTFVKKTFIQTFEL